MFQIAVLVSGGGSNLQALIDSIESQYIENARIAAVISSNRNAYALERARHHGINCAVFSKKDFKDETERENAMLAYLNPLKIDLIVLCGSLMVLGEKTLKAYENRIINIHPSLLPAFGGKGYYGIKIHEAAIKRGVKISGATVHFVNDVIDGGKIIAQSAIDVLPDDTPETLQKRVLETEWQILPKAVKMLLSEKEF
ncbi:MAG: phosphoribosylglycinamide formyltransferase [Defluviitaleaceae bacterium]|nr:phosphoribosylglycinamide formyltransferase [Defluviitaleaceae bacterium]